MSAFYGRLQSLVHQTGSRVNQQYRISQLNTGWHSRGGHGRGRRHVGRGYGRGRGHVRGG